jgi:hypothetical protein
MINLCFSKKCDFLVFYWKIVIFLISKMTTFCDFLKNTIFDDFGLFPRRKPGKMAKKGKNIDPFLYRNVLKSMFWQKNNSLIRFTSKIAESVIPSIRASTNSKTQKRGSKTGFSGNPGFSDPDFGTRFFS